MIWSSVAERENATFPVKFREKEPGFAIMQSRNAMRWKRIIRMCVWIMRKENE